MIILRLPTVIYKEITGKKRNKETRKKIPKLKAVISINYEMLKLSKGKIKYSNIVPILQFIALEQKL